MEKYKISLKKKSITFITIAIALYVTAVVLEILYTFNILVPADKYIMSGIFSGCIGAGTSSLVMGLYVKRILKNEEKFKKFYIENTDERRVLLERKAIYMAATILIALLFIVALVFAYIDLTVTVTLFAVFFVFFAIILLTGLYYSKKY